MGNMHLVTGYQGQEHVTAADHGSLYAAIFGSGSYVLDRGNKLAATVITNNQVRIADGDLVIQGRHARLNEGATVDLTIENGAQGYYRNDLIVARYTRNASTGVEETNLVVIKGTPVASGPADPEYTNGDILTDHAETADFPLYRIPLDGLTVGTPVQLFNVAYLVTLGSNKKVPAEYLPAMNYIPTSQKGAKNGVASLDSTGKVPSGQLPSMNYIPTSQKGVANGVASLDGNNKVYTAQIATNRTVTATSAEDGINLEKNDILCVEIGGMVFWRVSLTFSSNTPFKTVRVTFKGKMPFGSDEALDGVGVDNYNDEYVCVDFASASSGNTNYDQIMAVIDFEESKTYHDVDYCGFAKIK